MAAVTRAVIADVLRLPVAAKYLSSAVVQLLLVAARPQATVAMAAAIAVAVEQQEVRFAAQAVRQLWVADAARAVATAAATADVLWAAMGCGCASAPMAAPVYNSAPVNHSVPMQAAPAADAVPMPPAPIVDPSASLTSKRRVIQASATFVR